MLKILSFILASMLCLSVHAQSNNISPYDSTDYYYQIPSYPESYTAESVAARLIDGLGFRFYWATENLREEDLNYRPSEEGRSSGETLDHIFALSLTIINAVNNKPNTRVDRSGMSDAEKREKALENMRLASENLKAADKGAMQNMNVIFAREAGTVEFPFWNMINGPITDAIYHTGQIVTFRRSSGNPINPNISVLQGKKR